MEFGAKVTVPLSLSFMNTAYCLVSLSALAEIKSTTSTLAVKELKNQLRTRVWLFNTQVEI